MEKTLIHIILHKTNSLHVCLIKSYNLGITYFTQYSFEIGTTFSQGFSSLLSPYSNDIFLLSTCTCLTPLNSIIYCFIHQCNSITCFPLIWLNGILGGIFLPSPLSSIVRYDFFCAKNNKDSIWKKSEWTS